MLFFHTAFAMLNAQTFLNAAWNLSVFETSNVTSKPGFSIAVGKQWKIFKEIGLMGELRYSQRKVHIKNKSFKTGNFNPEVSDIYYVNYNILRNSIDLPIFLAFNFPINKKRCQFHLGYSISMDLVGKANIEVIRTEPFSKLNEEEKRSFKFDYESIGEREIVVYGYSSFECGFLIYWKKYTTQISFIRSYVNVLDGVYFKEYLDSISIGISILL